MMFAVQHVNGKVLWANSHLLFWLSLIPFTTAWMGENHFTMWPVAFYGVILMMGGIAYYILAHTLIQLHGKDSTLARALGRDYKGIISVLIYVAAIPLAFVNSWISLAMYAMVIAMWLIPDKRIEKTVIKQ